MSKRRLRFVPLILLFFAGCELALIGEEPDNTFSENFEVFWEEFDRNYSFFEIKKIDWDSVYHLYKPQVATAQSEEYLFYLFSQIALSLEDGHVNVVSPYGISSYDFAAEAPENNPNSAKGYISSTRRIGNSIEYSEVIQNNLGYILIKNFGSDVREYEQIEQILQDFVEKDGIIIDVRSNGGGTTTNSRAIASRFADKRRLYVKVKYRDGPGHGDFTRWYERHIEPEGPVQFSKPVVVLTNRRTYSSAEDFVLAMRLFPNVTILGDTTGGGSGNPILRELPNGWTFRLSSWVAADPDGNSFEGVGLVPDVLVSNTEEDDEKFLDRMFEEAVNEVYR